MFPKLHKVAMMIFVTPGSSCSSERLFSVSKEVVSTERSSLSVERVSKTIVFRSLADSN